MSAAMRPLSTILGALVFGGAAVGCGSDPTPTPTRPNDGFDPATCQTQCASDPMTRDLKYCGTDRRTYDGCAWLCGTTPSGVGVFPSACQPDGSPAAGSPTDPADGQTICDWTPGEAGQWIPLECASDLDDSVGQTGGSVMRTMSAPAGDLRPEVDHRSRFVRPKNQGSTMMCTSFSTVAAMESALGAANRTPVSLSEMHLWARYHTASPERALTAARSGGVASEDDADAAGLGFSSELGNAWLRNRSTPDAAIVARLDMAARFGVTAVDVLEHPNAPTPTPDAFARVLSSGRDVVAAFYTGVAWARARVGADGVIPDYDLDARNGHAVLLVGYKTLNGRRYFIVRNSWGNTWGDGGYGYLSERSFVANLIPAPHYTVSVDAVRAEPQPDCAMGQRPASDGRCRTVCADGSLADEMGQCATAMCDAPQVPDAHGECVRGCATGSGDLDGVGHYECTPGACRWTIPNGTLGCVGTRTDPMAACVRTCEAPQCDGFATDAGRFACRAPDA